MSCTQSDEGYLSLRPPPSTRHSHTLSPRTFLSRGFPRLLSLYETTSSSSPRPRSPSHSSCEASETVLWNQLILFSTKKQKRKRFCFRPEERGGGEPRYIYKRGRLTFGIYLLYFPVDSTVRVSLSSPPPSSPRLVEVRVVIDNDTTTTNNIIIPAFLYYCRLGRYLAWYPPWIHR